MIHIKHEHYEEVRKMFAVDACENVEADEEYIRWLNAKADIYKDIDKQLIKQLHINMIFAPPSQHACPLPYQRCPSPNFI